MVVTAIVAEFNPFHKGHEYMINNARQITGADVIVVVMSGNFTQRGDIAIAPKHVRALSAVKCGADIVFELPFAYAASSAEIFAQGAVSLIEALGFVDYIAFGSESGDVGELTEAAELLAVETKAFKEILNEHLSAGLSFPEAREKAFIAAGGKKEIFTPNNILAIEYIKALIKIKSKIKPITIKRIGTGYNDKDYQPDKGFISASAFREKLKDIMGSTQTDLKSKIEKEEMLSSDSKIFVNSETKMGCHSNAELFLQKTLPKGVCDCFMDNYSKCFPIYNDDMLPLLRYALIMNGSYLRDFADFSPSLAERFNNLREKKGNSLFTKGYEDLILELKTKDMTATRIKRAIIHVLMGFTTVNSKEAMNIALEGKLPYARLLAFSENGRMALNYARKNSDICIINSVGKTLKNIEKDEKASQLFYFDILAADVYADIVFARFGYDMQDEYRQKVLMQLKD